MEHLSADLYWAGFLMGQPKHDRAGLCAPMCTAKHFMLGCGFIMIAYHDFFDLVFILMFVI